MGVIDVIDELDLADEVKDRLRQEHEQEAEEHRGTRRELNRNNVEQEIKDLTQMGFEEAPGLLKYVRRVFLSDDEEPGLVLLSDNELHLSGDDATGAKQREEVTAAGVLREFIKLMPKNEEGKLAVKLSDQALEDEEGRKPNNDDEQGAADAEGARTRLSQVTGRPVGQVQRKRYRRNGVSVNGGDN